MTKTYFPFDAGLGANSLEDRWRLMAQMWLATGVLAGHLNQHAPFADSTGMQVKVKSGRSWIMGHLFEDDAQETIAIAASDPTNPRIDRLVIRADFTANTVDYAILQGTPAASPVVVALTQSATRWEIGIAQILVSAAVGTIAATKVTDERQYAKNFNVAGDVVPQNELVNGEIDIWQRGAGAFTASLAYTADRWQIVLAGTDTLSVTQMATAANKKPNSKYSASLVFVLGTGAGATAWKQVLKIADGYEHLLGQAVSARGALKTATGVAVRLFVKTDGTGGTTTYSDYHAGDAAFDDLMVQNVTVPTDATYVEVGLAFAASATVYADNLQLNLGAVCAAFRPLHPAEDLARCLRYYELYGGGASVIAFNTWAAAAQAYYFALPFKAVKAVVPTMTRNGTWAVSANTNQPAILGANQYSAAIDITTTSATAGKYGASPDSADDTIVAEANP